MQHGTVRNVCAEMKAAWFENNDRAVSKVKRKVCYSCVIKVSVGCICMSKVVKLLYVSGKVILAAKKLASGGRIAVAHLASLENFLRPGRKILRS